MVLPESPSSHPPGLSIDLLDHAVMFLDSEGRLGSLNVAWEALLGYAREESLRRSLGDFLHGADAVGYAGVWADLRAGTRRVYRGELRFLTVGGAERWMLVALRRRDEPEGAFAGVTGTLTDITELKATVEKVRVEAAAVAETNREKIEFVASLGHELRTPLNAVIGLTESLIEVAPAFDPDRTKRYLGIIHQSGRQLLTQINDLVDISRIDARRTKAEAVSTELGALCGSIAEAAQREARGRAIEVVCTPPAVPCRVRADERLLRRAVQALLAHTIKITPVKGRVSVELLVRPCGGTVLVKDSASINVAAKFAAPAAAGRQLDGADLVLALVERVARLHGGALAVTNTAGQGNTYAVDLADFCATAPATTAPLP